MESYYGYIVIFLLTVIVILLYVIHSQLAYLTRVGHGILNRAAEIESVRMDLSDIRNKVVPIEDTEVG